MSRSRITRSFTVAARYEPRYISNMKFQICLFGLLFISALTTGCTRNEPEVVAYISADEHIARQIIQKFEKDTGITVQFVCDTEVNKTTGLAQRLKAEINNPQADVFWSSEVFQTIELADAGVLEPYQSPAANNWPAGFIDKQHRWTGFAARARVIVYNTEAISEDAVPKTWMDLTSDSRFKDRIVMADPRFGTTGGHLAAMDVYWSFEISPHYYEAFLMGLAEQNVRLLPSGNAGVVEQVATGEADVGMTDTDDVWAAQAHGLPVDLVYARHEAGDDRGGGTLLIPNTVALVKGGPNQENAKKLIDFLLSDEVETLLAESQSHNIPIRPGLAGKYPQYAVPDPLKMSYETAAKKRAEAIELAMKLLAERAKPQAAEDPDAR